MGKYYGYCKCGAGKTSCHCQCNRDSINNEYAFVPGLCSTKTRGEESVFQPIFKCITCRFLGNQGCCENCAKTCHLGHILMYIGPVSSYCNCGKNNPNCKCIGIPNQE